MTGSILKVIALVAALFYCGAFVLELMYSRTRKKNSDEAKAKRFRLIGRILWGLGFAANLTLVINNYLHNGYVPFVSIYQVLTFLGICFLPIYIYMHFVRRGEWMARYFTLMPTVIMLGLVFMDATDVWEFPPALQSPWFVPHILVYMIAYTMGAVEFLMCVQSIFTSKRQEKLRLEGGVYDCVCVLFPFMTMGMFFGAIWANEVWGAFWAWDFKEIWSLATWLIFMLYLHFRREEKLKNTASVFALLGFVGIVITFLFVQFIPAASMHTYST